MDIINQFKDYLVRKKVNNPVTLKNYLSDLRHFINWYEKSIGPFSEYDFDEKIIKLYEGSNGATILPGGGIDLSEKMSHASLKRRLSSLRQFAKYLTEENILHDNPFSMLESNSSKADNFDHWHIQEFKDYLKFKKASDLTIKNYITDIHSFRRWHENAIEPQTGRTDFPVINDSVVEEYKKRLIEHKGSAPRTINRKLSSLRKFVEFSIVSNFVVKDFFYPQEKVENLEVDKNEVKSVGAISLNDIEGHKIKLNYSPIPPIRLVQKLIILPYLLLESAIAGKIISLVYGNAALALAAKKTLPVLNKMHLPHKPSDLLKVKGYEKEFYAPNEVSLDNYPFHKKLWHHVRHTRPEWYRRYHNLPLVHYIHFAVLIIFAAGAGLALYRNLVADVSNPLFAAPTSPPRILSFQGRLTDNLNNPITSATSIRFSIYDDLSASGSALLWQEVHYGTIPDQDGIFSVLLGTNNAIPDDVFFENNDIYLGVTIEQTDELTPRRRIASVPYAANSESLQGMLPITDGGAGQTNVVLALDSSGDLTIGGSANPTFSASGGQFTLSGDVLLLTTETGTDSNIIISPDGLGGIDIQKPLFNTSANGNLTPGGVEINDKFGVLATESAVAAFTLNNDGASDLFTASSSGTSRFTIANDGTLTIPVYNTAGGLLYANGSGVVGQTAAGTGTQCLLGGTTPTWGSCGTGTNPSPFQVLDGAIVPLNSTLDFMIGGQATDSAKFAVLNMNSGTPVASVSATSGNGVSIGGDGRIQSLRNNTLIIGGTTTGNVVISPSNGSGRVGINTGANLPRATLDIMGTGNVAIFGSDSLTDEYIAVRNTSSGVMFGLDPDLNSGNGSGLIQSGNSKGLAFDTNNGTWGSATTPDMYIDTSGNVGIGTVTPLGKLDVVGNATISGNLTLYGAVRRIQTTSNNTLIIGGTSTGDIHLSPLNGSGRVGINTAVPGEALDVNGNILLAGGGTFDTRTANTLGIGTTNATTITLGRTGQGITLPAFTTDGGIFYANGTGQLAQTSAGLLGECLQSAGSGSPTWGTCGSGGAFQELNGAIVPNNSTLDFLVGGQATDSARFGILNVNDDTPIASLSASTGEGLYLSYDGTIQTTLDRTLVLGGDSTGNIALMPKNGTGYVGIGTTSPLAPLHIQGGASSVYLSNVGESISSQYFLAPGNDNFLTGVLTGDSGIKTHTSLGGFVLGRNGGNVEFKMTNGGLFGIGTYYSPTGVDPTAKFQVYSNLGTEPAASISAVTSAPTLLVTNDGVGDLFAASSSGTPSFIINNNGDIIVGPEGSGKITAAVIDPYLIQNQYTSGNTELTFQTMAASNGDFIFQNQSTDLATLFQEGLLHLEVNGATGGLQLGDDTQLFRGAADRIDVSSGDSFNLVAGNYQLGGSTIIDSSGNATFNDITINGACSGCVSPGTLSPFQIASGAIVPNNSTLDFLIGGQATSSADFAILNVNGTGPAIASASGNLIVMPNNGAGGRVGIGTSSPNARLHLSESSNNIELLNGTYGLFASGNDFASRFYIDATSNAHISLDKGATTNNASIQFLIAGVSNWNLGTTDSDIAGNGNEFFIGRTAGGASPALFIESNDTVGIGTTTPASSLHVTRPLTYGATGKALAIFDQIEDQDIFTASAGGTTRFTIGNSGNLAATGTLTGLTGLTSSGAITFSSLNTNGGLLYGNGSGVVAQTGAGTGSQCLLGGTTPTWGSCATGTTASPFTELNGAIVPNNSTLDFLIGGQATDSAKFAVLNANGSGPATASVSGNLILMPHNGAGGRLGLGTTAPSSLLAFAEGTTEEGGITFGSDANLFRSGTSTLSTLNNFFVGSTTPTVSNGSIDSVQTYLVNDDEDAFYGEHSAIGSDGFFRVAYTDDSNGVLHFTQCTDIECDSPNTAEAVNLGGYYAEVSGMILGNDDYGRIVYVDDLTGDLEFVQCTNATCSTSNTNTLDSSDYSDLNSLVLGNDGLARILYQDDGNGELKFVQCTNASCSTNNQTALYSNYEEIEYDIAIGADGFARMAVTNQTDGDLEFIQCTNASCSTRNTTAITSGNYDWPYFLELASDGFARIIYMDDNTGDMIYYQCTNASCSTGSGQTIDADDYSDFMVATLDGNDLARIVFEDDGSEEMKYIECTNASCSTNNIVVLADNSQNSNWAYGMTLDSSDNPQIVYINESSNRFYLYKCSDSSCSSSTNTSIAIGNEPDSSPIPVGIDNNGVTYFMYISSDDNANEYHLYSANITPETYDPDGDDLYVAGDIAAGGNIYTDGNLVVGGTANFGGIVNITGSINFDGPAVFNNGLTAYGTSIFDSITINNSLNVNGSISTSYISTNYLYVSSNIEQTGAGIYSTYSVPISIGASNDVYVSGRYAYFANDTSGLRIVDITRPGTTSIVGTYNTSGTAYDVFVSGKYAYVADGASGLQIVDVSNPSSPSLAGTYNTSGTAYGIYVSGKYAYVADDTAGLHIIDISDPESPLLTGTYNTSGNARNVFVAGKYAYVADGTAGLVIVDISNPSTPTSPGTYDSSGTAADVYVSGKYAYLADTNGFRVVDVSNPSSPSLTGSTFGSPTRVEVVGNYAYTVDSAFYIRIYNISTPTSPFASQLNFVASSLTGLSVSGKFIYMSVGDSTGLRVSELYGTTTSTLYAGDIQTNDINVTENGIFGNDLYVRSGLMVGDGGIQSQGGLGIFSGFATNMIEGAATGKALLTINETGNQDIFTASSSGTPRFSITNAGGIKLGTSEGTSGQCLQSGGVGIAATWGSCTGGATSSPFQIASGSIQPINSTLDFLIGGQATASADFAVLNVNGTGPATASVSGNLIVMPNNGAGGRVGIGTTDTSHSFINISSEDSGNILNVFNPIYPDLNFTISNNYPGFNALTTLSSQDEDLGYYANLDLDAYNDIELKNCSSNGYAGFQVDAGDEGTPSLLGNVGDSCGSPTASDHFSFQINTFSIGAGATPESLKGRFQVDGSKVGKALAVFNETGTNDILTASSSGTTRLSLNNAGQLRLPTQGSTGGLTIGGDTNLYRTATDVLATDDAFQVGTKLTLSGTTTSFDNTAEVIQSLGTGDLTVAARGDLRFNIDSNANGSNLFRILAHTSNQLLTLDESGNLSLLAGGSLDTLSGGTLGIGNTTATTITIGRTGQGITLPGFDCSALTGGGKLTTTSGGVLTCANGGGSGGTFQELAGSIVPNNSTLDFLIGAQATESAKFAILNVNGSGPATATVSGNLTVMPRNGAGGNVAIGTINPLAPFHVYKAGTNDPIAIFETGNGGSVMFSGQNATLSLKIINNPGNDNFITGSVAGDSGIIYNNAFGFLIGPEGNNVALRIDGDNKLGLGTNSPLSQFHVTRNLADGATGKALGIFNQTENQDIFTASASGVTKFTVAANGSTNILDQDGLNVGEIGKQLNVFTTGGGIDLSWSPGHDLFLGYSRALGDDLIIGGGGNGLRVGIGTISPISQLHVTRPLTGGTTGKALAIFDQTESQDILAASASGATRFRIGNSGEITIYDDLLPATDDTIHLGSTDFAFNTVWTNSVAAGGSDLAEYYKKANPSEQFEAGQLVCLSSNGGVTKCAQEITGSILGVISDNAAFIGGSKHTDDDNYVLVGLVGQLDVRVQGDIKAGDALTVSSTTGVATKATKESYIIGRALQNNQNGQLQRVATSIQAGYFNPNLALNTAGDDTTTFIASLNINEENGIFSITDAGGNLIDRTSAFSNLVAANIKAGFINVQKLSADTISATTGTFSNLTTGVANITSATVGSLSVGSENVLIAGTSLRDYVAGIVEEIIADNVFTNGDEILSPVASIDRINTNIISPLGDGASIEIEVKPESIAINNTDTGEKVAEIDDDGNATFSGTLASNNLSTNDATISGTLSADRIIANSIDGLDERISSIAGTLANNNQSTPSGNIAYGNEIETGNIYADFGIYSEGLTVLGSTTTSSLTAMDTIAIGTGFIMTDNSINTLGTTLQIQPLRQGNIDFMAGRVTIDTDGNMDIAGNLNVAGIINAPTGIFNDLKVSNLATNIISPLGGSDLTIKLGNETTASNSSNLKVTNSQGNEVLKISGEGNIAASGSATFDKLNFNLVGEALADSDTTAIATGSAGFATLNRNRPEITIYNDKITENSLIYITPFGDTQNKVLYLLRQVPHSETNDGSFTVGVSGIPSTRDIQFNWLIVN